jgi:hypothetical protein
VRDLATKTLDGIVVLSPHGLSRLSDEKVKARLTAVRGNGPWTADMFLLFQLRRLDVWPTGDFGVRRGYGLAWAIPTPSAKELEALGDPYCPYRPVVAWYCSPRSFTPPPPPPWPPDRERSLAGVAPRGYPADRPGGGKSGLHLLTPRAALEAHAPHSTRLLLREPGGMSPFARIARPGRSVGSCFGCASASRRGFKRTAAAGMDDRPADLQDPPKKAVTGP